MYEVKRIPNYDTDTHKGYGVFEGEALDIWFQDEIRANRYADGRNKQLTCAHEWRFVRDSYGSLGEGGDYEVFRCDQCGKFEHRNLAD